MATSSPFPVLPERIVSDFGGKAEPTQAGVRALASAISRASLKAAETWLEPWTALFRKTCGQDWPRPKARLDRLARHYGIAHDPARPEIVLFALQSWYVLLVKLLVAHVVSAARGRKSPLLDADPGSVVHVRALIESIESGHLFAALGVTDPCCGEPFGWAVSAWSPALERAMVQATVAHRPLRSHGDRYPCGRRRRSARSRSTNRSFPVPCDMPSANTTRPAGWRRHVLDQVGYSGQAEARLLDPTCGSGTFLLAALKRWRQSSRHAPRAVRPGRQPHLFGRTAHRPRPWIHGARHGARCLLLSQASPLHPAPPP